MDSACMNGNAAAEARLGSAPKRRSFASNGWPPWTASSTSVGWSTSQWSWRGGKRSTSGANRRERLGTRRSRSHWCGLKTSWPCRLGGPDICHIWAAPGRTRHPTRDGGRRYFIEDFSHPGLGMGLSNPRAWTEEAGITDLGLIRMVYHISWLLVLETETEMQQSPVQTLLVCIVSFHTLRCWKLAGDATLHWAPSTGD